MKIELLKEHLLDVTQIISRVSNKNLSLPVLGCVVISAVGGRVTFQATNLEVSVELQVKSKIEKEGVVAVPAHTLHQLITTSTDQKITLEVKENTLIISSSHGVSKLKTLDVSEFPTLPFVKQGEGHTLTIPTKNLTTALKTVSFASSHTGIRPELSSVFLKVVDGFITTAATDSFRLAEMKTPTQSKDATEPILIPHRNIQEILRVIEGSEVVEIRVGDNQTTLLSNGNYITSRIIDGAFPDYHAIIPKNFTTKTVILTSEVASALKKVLVFTDHTGCVEVTVNDKKLTLKASNTAVGETVEEVDAVIEGDNLTLSFNSKYLLDALSVVTADSVALNFSGPGKPLVFGEVPARGFTYLVMPMNK